MCGCRNSVLRPALLSKSICPHVPPAKKGGVHVPRVLRGGATHEATAAAKQVRATLLCNRGAAVL